MPEKATLARRAAWYSCAALLLALDQWTKVLATSHLQFAEPVVLNPYLNLTLLYNTGAAFSFLADAGGWQQWLFGGVAVSVSIVLTVWLWRLPTQARLLGSALTLVLAGAVGNLIDRLRLGHVVDFVQLHYQDYYWPAFNLADAAISVGAVLLIVDALRTDSSTAGLATDKQDGA